MESKAVTLTQQYVGQINSHHRIEVRTPEAGYLGAIPIKEGQTVKRDDLLFQVKSGTAQGKSETEKEGKLVSIRAAFRRRGGRPA